MRSFLLLALGLSALLLPSCHCGSVGPEDDLDSGLPPSCGCPDAQICGPAGTCVPALTEGMLCAVSPDGGAVVGACLRDLSCGYVGDGQERCSVDCTSVTEASLCGTGRTCFARPKSPSTEGYCGTSSGLGATCGAEALAFCSAKDEMLLCLSPSGESGGACYLECDPTSPDPNPTCAANASCSQLFADQTVGVCVVPVGHYPASCDYAKMGFCARGELCIRPDDTKTAGYCHLTCGKPQDCPAGQTCTSPSVGLSICAAPVARCDVDPSLAPDAGGCPRCSPDEDQYCGPEDVCVRMGDVPVCKQDCTGGGKTCASGTCQKLQGSDRSACL